MSDGTSFATHGKSEDRTNNAKKDKSHIVCFRCSGHGHYASECDAEMTQLSKETEGHQHLTTGVANTESRTSNEEDIDFVFLMTGEGVQLAGQGNKAGSIPKTWILLDSQSTIDVFSNPCLVWNIQPSEE